MVPSLYPESADDLFGETRSVSGAHLILDIQEDRSNKLWQDLEPVYRVSVQLPMEASDELRKYLVKHRNVIGLAPNSMSARTIRFRFLIQLKIYGASKNDPNLWAKRSDRIFEVWQEISDAIKEIVFSDDEDEKDGPDSVRLPFLN
jgi:hypothetical protein